MSITRLQQARQMYAMGQRVAKTLDGSRPGYRGSDYGDEARGTGAYGGGGNGGGYNQGRNMANIAGPVTAPPDMSHFGDTGDIVQADFTPYNQRPDTITSFFDNYKANVRSNPFNLGTIGALKTLYQTQQAKDLLGFGPTVGPDFTGGDGGDNGIMNLYTPNMLNVAGPVVDEDEIDEEEDNSLTDFIQRFRGLNETRQDKLGQLDPQIIAMINKLYTTPKV